MSNTLIRNGTVITAHDSRAADVLIEGERIKEVRAGIPASAAAKVIDAAGMYVIPGGIDHLGRRACGNSGAHFFDAFAFDQYVGDPGIVRRDHRAIANQCV